MSRDALILIYGILLLLILIPFSSAEDGLEKIDSSLAEIIERGGSEEIPVIVMLRSDEDLASDSMLADEGISVKYRYQIIPGLAGEATGQAIDGLAKDERVSGIYLDRSTMISQSDSPASAVQENETDRANSSSPPENSTLQEQAFDSELSLEGYISPAQVIRADRLWEKGIDGRGITVAVIDSGIDKNHPDLVGKVVAEKNFLSDEITADDLLGHGTMVAGIIAGSGAASGGEYRGIAPGADLISVKVIDGQGDGKVSDIIAGMEWAVYSGADVLSLSLGGINLNPPITMAADNAAAAGVVVCVAAGNRNSSETQATVAKSVARSSSASDHIDSENAEGGYLESLAQLMSKRARGETEDRAVRVLQQGGSEQQDVLLLLVPVVVALPPGLIDSPGDGVKVVTVGAADS
ncbi:MAG: peptidase families S8 and S53 protein, partial [Methanosaeta sp. ASM2]